MSKNAIKFVKCYCGHSAINHVFHLKYNDHYTIQGNCGVPGSCGVIACACVKFKMDNLIFLEDENDVRE